MFLFVASVASADHGALNSNVTHDTITQTICVRGYTKSVRPSTSFTNSVKGLLLKRARYVIVNLTIDVL